MFDLYSFAPLLGFFFGLFATIVIVLKQQQPVYRKTLLLLFLFSITLYCVPVYFVNSGKVLTSPHFFRTGSPFLYLLSISLFLLGRAYLYNIKKAGTLDYILLLIPVLHTIELIPYFSKSADEKLILIKQFIDNKDNIYSVDTSFIPTFWHYTIQGILGILSASFVLFKFIKNTLSKKETIFKSQLNWLFFIALSIFLYFSIATIAYFIIQPERLFFQQFASIFLACILIMIVLLIFLSPQLLYNIDLVSPQNKTTKNHSSKQKINTEINSKVKQDIEDYFQNNTDFLQHDFRLQNLAEHLNINKNLLSQIINSAYHQNFNQFINDKRISFALKKIDDDTWQNLSIEGMAESVGFKSRTTFNKAFKEKTGFTPSEYISKRL